MVVQGEGRDESADCSSIHDEEKKTENGNIFGRADVILLKFCAQVVRVKDCLSMTNCPKWTLSGHVTFLSLTSQNISEIAKARNFTFCRVVCHMKY